MMKKLLFLGILAVFIASCKKENSTALPEITEESYFYGNDTNYTTLSMATEIAENIKKSDVQKLLSKRSNLKSSFSKRKIRQSFTLRDKEAPFFYVFNYDSGYSIIPADKRIMPILAYSEKGNINQVDSLPLGLIIWLESQAEGIRTVRKNRSKATREVTEQWLTIAPIKDTPYDEGSSDFQRPLSSTVVGPLMKSTWGQGYGYNTYCPTQDAPGYGNHALTGCVATAMGQVMRYWKYPTTYNWSAMPLNTYSTAVARLLADIGTSVNMDYGPVAEGSGAATEKIVPGFKQFKYTSANLYDYYDYQKVKANLTAKMPVVLVGYATRTYTLGIFPSYSNGHCWVCEGYTSTSYQTYGTLYYYMNWGWNSNKDGWYAYNAPWNTGAYTFQYNIKMICDIKP